MNKGFLGKIVLDSLSANDSAHAALVAYRAMASAVSNISVYLDIPMHIYQMDVTELRTNTVLTSLMAPFIETPLFSIPTEEMTEAFRIYASIYREALISNSANYQFLCYYKIIEGIRKRQERLIAEARAKGEQPVARPKLVIPRTTEGQISWLDSLFPVRRSWDVMVLDSTFPQQSLDRKVKQVVDKELEPIRNRIAHSVLRGGEPALSMDERLDADAVQQWLPLTKCIARLSMKSESPEAFSK